MSTVKHHIQHAGNGSGIVVCASVVSWVVLVMLSVLLLAGPKCQASWTRKTVMFALRALGAVRLPAQGTGVSTGGRAHSSHDVPRDFPFDCRWVQHARHHGPEGQL